MTMQTSCDVDTELYCTAVFDVAPPKGGWGGTDAWTGRRVCMNAAPIQYKTSVSRKEKRYKSVRIKAKKMSLMFNCKKIKGGAGPRPFRRRLHESVSPPDEVWRLWLWGGRGPHTVVTLMTTSRLAAPRRGSPGLSWLRMWRRV